MTDVGLRIRLDRALRHTQRQHSELAELERELQQAVDQDDEAEIQVWLERYASGLQAHFVLEEEMLFPILIRVDGELDSNVRKLLDQHDRLRGDLSKLAAESNAYSVASGLAALKVEMAAHARLEEGLAIDALGELPQHLPDPAAPRRSL